MHQKISRIMIEAAVDKELHEIEANSKRSIRNLVDLGDYFAKGRFQKDFFRIAQKMLEDDNSSYYDLVFDAVHNVDHRILKTFGINIGLNSWTYGANKIREFEKENGCNVPWDVIFDFQKQADNPLALSEIRNIIQQGKKIGIYSYLFIEGQNTSRIDELLEIFRQNLDCAFTVYTHPHSIENDYAYRLREYGNALVSLCMDDSVQEFNKAVKALQDSKCLLGVHRIYDDNNSHAVLNGSWMKEIIKLHCTFAFLIKGEECSKGNKKAIESYVQDIKAKQKYPVFLMNLYDDISYIDRIISVEPCLFKILQDGTIVTENGVYDTGFHASSASLSKILSQTMPKVGYL